MGAEHVSVLGLEGRKRRVVCPAKAQLRVGQTKGSGAPYRPGAPAYRRRSSRYAGALRGGLGGAGRGQPAVAWPPRLGSGERCMVGVDRPRPPRRAARQVGVRRGRSARGASRSIGTGRSIWRRSLRACAAWSIQELHFTPLGSTGSLLPVVVRPLASTMEYIRTCPTCRCIKANQAHQSRSPLPSAHVDAPRHCSGKCIGLDFIELPTTSSVNDLM